MWYHLCDFGGAPKMKGGIPTCKIMHTQTYVIKSGDIAKIWPI